MEVENMYVMRQKDCWSRFNPRNPRQQYIICKPKMKETFEEILDKMNIQARRAETPITTTLRARDEFSRVPNPNKRGGGLFPPPKETPEGTGETDEEEEIEQVARGSGMMAVRSLTPSTSPASSSASSIASTPRQRSRNPTPPSRTPSPPSVGDSVVLMKNYWDKKIKGLNKGKPVSRESKFELLDELRKMFSKRGMLPRGGTKRALYEKIKLKLKEL